MARFFYRSEREEERLKEILAQLNIVNIKIRGFVKERNGYELPDMFNSNWLMFVSSDGDILQENYIKNNLTCVEFYERVLFKQVKNLKEMEASNVDK